ncbi:hypothetical protein QQG74_08090 [Micromonospora sp. FIMYZ51]
MGERIIRVVRWRVMSGESTAGPAEAGNPDDDEQDLPREVAS